MDVRFTRDSWKENKRSFSLQKQMVEERRAREPEPVPDLTELMNDWFFGSSTNRESSKACNVSGGGMIDYADEDSLKSNSGSNSRLTQEWLEEAKRMVASSPSRCESPSRLVGSPRFAAAGARDFDRRDPLSRSARRHRTVESFSGEILSKSAKHSRNKSENFQPRPQQTAEISPASAVHQWFSNILRPHAPSSQPKQENHQNSSEFDQSDSDQDQKIQAKPPRQPIRKSRFRDDSSATQSADKPIQSRRTFRNQATVTDNRVLSPPKNLIEPTPRSSSLSSMGSVSNNQVLSPPRNLVESVHRRSISSSTCSLDKISLRPDSNSKVKEVGDDVRDLNKFLKEQKSEIGRISNGEINAKARIVLSGSSNSTSSMVATICYAWFLDNRSKERKEEDVGDRTVVVPVINMKRGQMWKQRQAAWLFHHVGIDANVVLFSDEVELENLMMGQQLNILVIGQDVLQTNGEVGSQCTILTDNYCEDAYDLLQISILKKLLLAGILLDTQNLNAIAKLSMNRDAEAVQLLLVGSAPNYRNVLFDQLMQDQQDGSFLEAMRHNYGKPLNESDDENGDPVEHMVSGVSGRRSTFITYNQGTITQISDKNSNNAKGVKTSTVLSTSATKPKPAGAPAQAKAREPEPPTRGKNKFSLSKWFGFGSK